jgi:beta-fructofuranosidase
MIGWMQSWAASRAVRPGLPFFGQMTIPRELFLRAGRLCQRPVRELERCRRNRVCYEGVPVSDWQSLPGVSGRVLDMQLTIRGDYERFSIRAAEGEGLYTEITLLPLKGIIRTDRLMSGFTEDVAHVRDFPVDFTAGEIRLRVLMDKYSLELFVNGGEQAASMTLYTPLAADGIRFSAEGEALLDVEKYDLVMD